MKLRAQYNKYSIESVEYKDEARKRFETVIDRNKERLHATSLPKIKPMYQ